ncbi:MAG: putative membrane-bound spermidine synthase [Saprospiraceae bacterium]|jgi:predicted membrane-bound spermidine synthase
MKQPFWKIIKSYFVDVHLESTSSVFNDELDVLLVKGEYQLVTPEAIYSYGNRYDNFFDAFKKIGIEKYDIDSVLLLGLGLGSIPYMLEQYFKQDYSYTAVEIDEDIIYLASKYVINDLASEVSTICTDALHFVEIDTRMYDFVAMDVFVSDYIPEEFESEEFLRFLSYRIADDGLLLFNRLYFFEKDKKKTQRYFDTTFKKVFPNGRYLEINGNWILLNK